MDQMVGTLQQFFGVLQNAQDIIWLRNSTRWNPKPTQKAKTTFDLIKDNLRPIGERELSENLSPANPLNIDFSLLNRYLFLPPLDKNADFVPVLSLKCIINQTVMEIRYRVMLYTFDEHINDLCGIGFRIESPENNNGLQNEGEFQNDGSHDFYHSQLIKNFESGPTINCPEWLPCRQPSFPIVANCPVTMLIGLLLSLYGKIYSYKILNYSVIHNLDKYLKKIKPWISWEE
jgi:hypothetical protein